MSETENRTQTKQIVIRMTEDDYNLLKKQVEKSGMKQAEYLRQAILKKKIINTDGVKAVMPQLTRIGNNINQIARHCNAEQSVGISAMNSIEIIRGELNEAWRLLRQLAHGQVSDER